MVNYRPLGKTELELSEVGFGVWTVASGRWGPFTDEAAVDLLRRAYDAGINYFDTSNVDANGRGERLLGQAFRDRRDLVIISTKVGYAKPGTRDFSADHLRGSLDASLERLGSSYVDVLQLHHPTMDVVADEKVWATLEDLRASGKVRYYGMAMGPGPGWLDEGRAAMRKRDVGAIQVYYNVLEEEPSRKFFPVALEINQGMVIRGPHAGGVLEEDPEAATRFPSDEEGAVKPPEFVGRAKAQAANLRWIHEGRGMTMAQAAIKFILSEETVASVLPNIYRPEQVDAYCAVSDFEGFSQAELAEIAEQFRRGFGG